MKSHTGKVASAHVQSAMVPSPYSEINHWLLLAVVILQQKKPPVRSLDSLTKDSPITTLTDLTKYGSHVYVLVRRSELRASKIMAKRLMNNPKIVRSLYHHTHHLLQLTRLHRLSCGIPSQPNVKATATSSITSASKM